jgi:hypothetical protein
MNMIAIEFKAFGGSQILSHLIVSYPEQFVEVVLLPLTQSLDYDSPMHSLLESITYQYHRKVADIDVTLDSIYCHPVMNYIYPYLYARMGLEVWNRGEDSIQNTPEGAESLVCLIYQLDFFSVC